MTDGMATQPWTMPHAGRPVSTARGKRKAIMKRRASVVMIGVCFAVHGAAEGRGPEEENKTPMTQIVPPEAENRALAGKATAELPPALRHSAAGKSGQAQDTNTVESPIILKVGDGELRVRFQFTTLYIPANIPEGDDILVRFSRTKQCGYSRFFFLTYQASAREQHKKPTEGFFRVKGKAEKLECRSTRQTVLRIERYDDDEGLCVEAVAPGKANIVVSLAGRSVEIPFKVVQIPVRTGDYRIEEHTGRPSHTREDVIRILGLPDHREETTVRWPESMFCAGQHFSPPAGSSWRVERWKYDKYPGAEIVFVGNSAAYYARSTQAFEIADPP